MDKLKAALYTAVSLQRYLVNIVHSQDYISLSVVNNLHLTLIRKPSCYIGWSYFTFPQLKTSGKIILDEM